MSCRAGAKRVEAKGVFVGAEVVRGPHWRFGDQDGTRTRKRVLYVIKFDVFLYRWCRKDWQSGCHGGMEDCHCCRMNGEWGKVASIMLRFKKFGTSYFSAPLRRK